MTFPSLQAKVIVAPGTPEMHARRAERMWCGMSSEDHDDLWRNRDQSITYSYLFSFYILVSMSYCLHIYIYMLYMFIHTICIIMYRSSLVLFPASGVGYLFLGVDWLKGGSLDCKMPRGIWKNASCQPPLGGACCLFLILTGFTRIWDMKVWPGRNP